MSKNKGFNVKIYGMDYFLIFKDEGLYFKKKEDSLKDFYIPFEKINHWDGICLKNNFFLKIKFNTLFKIYMFLEILFLLLFINYNIVTIGLYLFFSLIVAGMLYIKTNYVIIFADLEKIPIRVKDNRRVCYLIKILNQNCKKLSLKEKVLFNTKFKIQQIKNTKENFKKEIENIEKEIRNRNENN